MRTAFAALRSLVYMSGFVTLWAWIALSLRRYDWMVLPEWCVPAGFVLITAGAAVALSSVGMFVWRGHGTPAPFDAPREFVAAGPYQVVRNPMYIGGLAALAGFGLVMQSPSMALFAPVWSLFAHLFVVAYEEPVLREKFGESYRRYCERVPRWIPHPRHS